MPHFSASTSVALASKTKLWINSLSPNNYIIKIIINDYIIDNFDLKKVRFLHAMPVRI